MSIDDRMGRLWEWYDALPERSRPFNLLYMVQLGFDTYVALSSYSSAAVLAPKIPTVGKAVSVPDNQAAPPPPAAESSHAAMQATLDLGGWNMSSFDDLQAMPSH